MRFLRPALVVLAGAAVLAAAGCAGRHGQVPQPATLQPYNGEWALDAVQPSRQGIQFASTDGYGFTRQTGQMVVAAMGLRAERFVLELSDSIFRVVRRRLPGVGLVSERFELTEDGTLMVIRTAAMRNVRGAEVSAIGALAISYIRATAPSQS